MVILILAGTLWSFLFLERLLVALPTRSQSAAPFAVTNFVYDDNGNLLSETTGTQVKSYTWDLDNRLRQVTLPGGATNLFDYDANGLRIRKNDSTGTTGFLLDGPSVLEELSPSGSTVTSYLTSPQVIDEIGSFQQAGATYYPLTDALGSIYVIADSTGAVVRTNSYDVYGARSTLGTGPQIDQGFAGLHHEPNSGQARAGQRTLDLNTGRWTSADPLSLLGGVNSYRYASNQPTQRLDPNGLFDLGGRVGTPGPALTTVDAYAKQNPVGFLALLADLGESAAVLAGLALALYPSGVDQEVCDKRRRPDPETYYRGLSKQDLSEYRFRGAIYSAHYRLYADISSAYALTLNPAVAFYHVRVGSSAIDSPFVSATKSLQVAIQFANPNPPRPDSTGVVVRIDTLRGFDLVPGKPTDAEVLFRVMIGGIFPDLIMPTMY